MKLDTGRWTLIFFLSFLMLGCSSIRARTEPSYSKMTVYPGVRLDIKETEKLFSSESSDPDWLKGIATVIYGVDLPFSSVFDTLIAPYDLYQIKASK